MFLAVALDNTCRRAIAAHLESSLDAQRLPGREVPPENWHITLRFLGMASQAQRHRVMAELDRHLMVEPFWLRIDGLGAFPRESRASALWAGVAGDTDSLAAVAEACETAAQRAGFEPQTRPFRPHVTLSRIRPAVDVRALVDRAPDASVSLRVAEVTLYRSLLGSGPARYEALEARALHQPGLGDVDA